MVPRICSPVSTILERSRRDFVLANLLRLLEDVGVKASGHMPCYVAMERPDTWIVRFPLQDLRHEMSVETNESIVSLWYTYEVTICWHNLNVTSLWVVCVDNGTVPRTSSGR